MEHTTRNTLVVLGLVVATALLILGGWATYDSWTVSRESAAARTTPFLVMDVDLSRPGTYEGTIHHFFHMAHANLLTLEVEPPVASADNALMPLVARTWMPEVPGYGCTIEGADRRFFGHAIGITLCRVSMASRGDIPFRVAVEKPAPEFSGRRQKLVGRYEVCGIERIYALCIGGLGAAFLIVGLAIGIPLLRYSRRLRREGRW